MNTWIKTHPKGSTLNLYIQPGASKDQIVGPHGERLKVKIKAPPVDGEANQRLRDFLSEFLGISKSKVEIIHGESSRQKILLVELPPEIIMELVERAL